MLRGSSKATSWFLSVRPRAVRYARACAVLVAASLAAACSDGPSGPRQGYTIRIVSGNGQFAGFDQFLEEPLRVIVEDANTGDPRAGVLVDWSVVSGSGAEVGSTTTSTDGSGIASTILRLGSSDTAYRVRATVSALVGRPATFDATAVAPAQVDAVLPAAAHAGDTVVITGTGFAPSPDGNTVLMAGFRARVLEASATQLRAIVPACVPTRVAALRVDRGPVVSNEVEIELTASDDAPLALAVGQVLHLKDADAASCVRLPAEDGARYLVVLQNAAQFGGQVMPWRLSGASFDPSIMVAPSRAPRRRAPVASRHASPAASSSARALPPQERLHDALRDAELRALERGAAPLPAAPAASRAPSAEDVEVGDERQFWVFRSSGDYARVTAVVRHISEHAILYEDVEAPAGGFEAGDYEAFGAVFDDPIYEAASAVYGAPSDVDGNARVIILFTPVVNRMTPPGSSTAFVAGFFFGIDLLDDQPRGNDAEVFYTLVPDPEGEFGNVRTFEQMLEGVPPVMAHEFQHMIHFNQRVLMRGAPLEVTWLSEGLAHTAEELVGGVLLEAGDDERALDFRLQNFLRADIYMSDPEQFSPLGPAVPLGVRGASWLLLEYLKGHFDDDAFLTAVTQATVSGIANLTARTGLDWGTILHRWALALWADDAGVPGLDPVYEFPNLNLRSTYQNVGFPLVPSPLTWGDVTATGQLTSAGAMYWMLDAVGEPGTSRFHMAVAGRHSPFVAADRPQLSILRVE